MLMPEQNKNRCAVLLPAGAHFERLFDEILESAIIETGLIPFRLQQISNSPIPINVFVEEIEQAGALLADISEDTREIWLAVGCAVALGNPLCLISSRPSLPLGIEHLPLIPYPSDALPSDYIQLQQNITAQLLAILPQPHMAKPEPEIQVPLPPPAPETKPSDDLASYEILALTIIDLKASGAGLSPRALGLEMQASESGHLTSHAMNALRRRSFIERKPVQITQGNEFHISENLFITRLGEEWLIRHGKRDNAQRSRTHSRAAFVNRR
jgi:hypothetical protein